MEEESDPETPDADESAGSPADEDDRAGRSGGDASESPESVSDDEGAATAETDGFDGHLAADDEAVEEFGEASDGFDRVDEADAPDDDEAVDADDALAADDEGVIETGPEADTDGGIAHVPAGAATPESDADAETEGPVAPEDDPELLDPDDPLQGDDEFGGGVLGEGPDHDEEMPLAAHIEEMMRRLGVVFLVAGVVTLAVFGLGKSPELQLFGYGRYLQAIPSSTEIIHFLWNHNIPGAPADPSMRPRVYGPLELILTELKVAGLAGLVVGLPVFVYETYLFMRPGLYSKERRYYLAAVPTSLVLALVGIAFAHFVVLPSLFAYFTSYTERAVLVAFGLKETFTLILVLMGYMAVIFQIPLFIMLAVMMNLVTRTWMEDRRIVFWGVFATVAFFATPDPTGMAPIIVGATMIALFEGTLALLRWTGN